MKDCLSLCVLDSFKIHVLPLVRILPLTAFMASKLCLCRNLFFENYVGNVLASEPHPSLITKVLDFRGSFAHIHIVKILIRTIVINHVFINFAVLSPGGLSFLVNILSLYVRCVTSLDKLSVLGIDDFLLEGFHKYVNAFLQFLNRTAHEKMIESASSVSHKGMFDLLPISIPVLMGQAQKDDIGLLGKVLRLLDNIDQHLFYRMLVRRDFLLDQNRSLPLEGVHGIGAVKLFFDVCVVSECF